MKKDLISLKKLTNAEIEHILDLAGRLKKGIGSFQKPLTGLSIGLIFQKPSNRTRVSFEVGIFQLGGNAIYLGPDDIKLGVREDTKDVAKVLSRYLDVIVARTFSHDDIVSMAKHAEIPVINALTDLLHPCQALSDLFTIKEKMGKLRNVNVAFIGDGNNVAHSLAYGAAITGMNLKIATPKGHAPKESVIADALKIAEESKSRIVVTNNPSEAVKGADIIYTDVWVSMGQEAQRAERIKAFEGFQVDEKLVAKANSECYIMHCLPAHRGEEISDVVIDSKNSIIVDQAENRLHAQKALLVTMLSGK